MQKATSLFNEDQRKQIASAVNAAESKTSCEIVPVVATASGRYDRPEDIVGLWLATIGGGIVWYCLPRQIADSGSWNAFSDVVGIIILIGVMIVGFITGAVAASRISWLRRWFTPKKEMKQEVFARAQETFFNKNIHHTENATGLLIYVSLFERVAVILGDQKVMHELGQDTLNQLCDQLTADFREGNATEAICKTIQEAGEFLSGPMPQQSDDANELKDTLVLLD
ncbi:TPM domain-containing protein [bacterium]|nr:TPM domain-containing protein [Rubripirellula sp.]MDB4419505.1 TPM domain-containing protein [bacterium]MDB4445932.1 TPM domain-containing protein [bacterium]MDB4500534.1 TPM domain-containing protein [bacterium]MDB4533112.1 TPM domain-containing protein [bacterium]MDB4621715.1 TPM domain-containing protein [Rubripirellula sp.]